MAFSNTGGAPWRVIVIQLLILSGLAVFFKFYLPHRTRAMEEAAVIVRENKINALFDDAVTKDSVHEITVPLEGALVKRHPQRLRLELSPGRAESILGVPDTITTDFGGGQHLTWIGTAHKLEASFNAGRIYCLKLEERATGHGVMVFESPYAWHPY